MCRWNQEDCRENKTRIEIRKNVETPAGMFDMEDTICICCGSKSSKCIIPESKIKKKNR
jgi:hypothetical protein